MVTRRPTNNIKKSRSDNVNMSKSNLFLMVSIYINEQRNSGSNYIMNVTICI